MITVSFRCPRCCTHMICGVDHDDAFAFASELPVFLCCGACGAGSFVVRSVACGPFLPDGYFGPSFGLCLKVAETCRRRAEGAIHFSSRESFRRLERAWLRLGQEGVFREQAMVVAARTISSHRQIEPRRSA